jgi:dTDP-4-dehydrorhamnose reductase
MPVNLGAQSKALITGGAGQLGRELCATVPAGWAAVGYSSDELDITRLESVADIFARERPAVVINAAAYTAVDAAERDAKRAEAVNALGAANVAEGAGRIGARLIQISTDFVFDGSQGRPYQAEDLQRPLNVYGRTKLAGEREVISRLGNEALIMRTAWLYSGQGRNFVLTMLRDMQERDEVGVVNDQIGTPTWARSLAEALWIAARQPGVHGIHHWTDAGVASWFDFAVAIQEEALGLGLLTRTVPIRPLRTEEYPTLARRPYYSVLDKTATWAALELRPPHWRVNLRHMLQGLASG